MTPRTALAAPLLAAGVLLLAGCSTAATTAEPSAPAASAAAPSAAASTPASTADVDAWAGNVCDATRDVKDSVNSLVGAVATGGTDIGASIAGQFQTIKDATAALATAVSAVPEGAGESPQVQAVRDSVATTRQSVDALSTSVADLGAASGIGVVTALPAVALAANDTLSAVGDTAGVIRTSIGDGTGPLGEAFRSNPKCAFLVQQAQ